MHGGLRGLKGVAVLEWDHGGVADWPAWATARVEVRPADPRWQRLGDLLRCELDLALAGG